MKKKLVNKINRKDLSFNENFFKIWSHDMAYVLGFWFADGCIHNNVFVITQNLTKSNGILNDILKILKSNATVRKITDSNCGCIEICSKEIVNDIILLGGKPNKSLNMDFPQIPKQYIPDFVRGYFDGDGYITYKKYKKNKICVCGFSSGSKEFLTKLHYILKKEIKHFRGGIHKRVRYEPKDRMINGKSPIKKGTYISYELQFSKNDAIRLRKFIYSENCICLERKRKIFLELGEPIKNVFGFKEYSEAKQYSRSLKLLGKQQWESFCSKNKKPVDIPYHPSSYYKNRGWISWQDWLGFKKEGKRKFFES